MPVLDACPTLAEIYASPANERLATTPIALEAAEALYTYVRERRPETCVEVGMALGASSLAILAGLEENGSGRLISIDPGQSKPDAERGWQRRGIDAVHRAGLAHRHTLVEEPSALALPDLWRQGMQVDLGYVDGWHTFDYVLLDVWFLDRMLPAGGTIALNDVWMDSVQRVISFLDTHRRYREVDVGLR